MTTLPANASDQRTETQMKATLDDMLACIGEAPGGAAPSTLNIASGAITPTGAFHTVDTETGSADDLTNAAITNHPSGRWLLLRVEDASRVVTIKHNQGGDGQFILTDGADYVMDSLRMYILFALNGTEWQQVAASNAAPKIAIFVEQQTQNTNGGGFTSGSWQTRVFNTTRINQSTIVVLSSNQFTPKAGTYLVEWSCPAHGVDGHVTHLYNATGTSVIAMGSTEVAATGSQSRSVGSATVVANGSTAYAIRHRAGTTKATDGLGKASNLDGVESYSQVKWTRLA